MEPNQPTQQPVQQPTNQPATPVESSTPPQEKRGNRLMIILALISLVILGLAGAYLFLIKSENNLFGRTENETVSNPTPASTPTIIDDTDPSSIEIDDPSVDVQGVENDLQGL